MGDIRSSHCRHRDPPLPCHTSCLAADYLGMEIVTNYDTPNRPGNGQLKPHQHLQVSLMPKSIWLYQCLIHMARLKSLAAICISAKVRKDFLDDDIGAASLASSLYIQCMQVRTSSQTVDDYSSLLYQHQI